MPPSGESRNIVQLQLGVSGSVLVDRSRLRVILDYIPEGILTCDAHGRVDGMNAAAERIFGYAESQLLGARLDVVLPDFGPQDLTSSLDRLAMRQAVSHRELAGHNVVLRHRNGAPMPGEILVSRTQVSGAAGYVVYIRDDTERSRTDLALRDSEARYRVLVENAPEAILVLDVDSGRFVDCNENAVRYFRMPRNDLMAIGPEQVSPQLQPDGNPSAAVLRENIDAALSCASPAFEWLHCDATGQDIASEVRFVRLPSAGRRLLRASIIDIAGRKRIESIAAGERRVFEKIASSSTLVAALDAITEVIESVNPDAVCCIRLYDPVRRILVHAAGPRLPRSYLAQMEEVPAEIRFGSCAAAVVLERQVVVPDIASDPFWEYRREAALTVGLHACWSTPIIASDGRLLGTFATYGRRCGLPSRRDLEVIGRMTQLARIAIEKRRTEDAVRASEQRFRGLFENVVEGVYQATLDGDLIDANPALVTMLGHAALNPVRDAWRDGRLFVDPGAREAMISRLVRAGEIVGAEFEMLRADGTAITVRENVRVTRDGQGRITGYEGTIGDVTERRRAEQRLFAEKERALVTLQAIADGVAVRLTYDGLTRAETTRPVVEPHRLTVRDGFVYLEAWSRDRSDWRTFRLDRVTAVRPRLLGEVADADVVVDHPVLAAELMMVQRSIDIRRHRDAQCVAVRVGDVVDAAALHHQAGDGRADRAGRRARALRFRRQHRARAQVQHRRVVLPDHRHHAAQRVRIECCATAVATVVQHHRELAIEIAAIGGGVVAGVAIGQRVQDGRHVRRRRRRVQADGQRARAAAAHDRGGRSRFDRFAHESGARRGVASQRLASDARINVASDLDRLDGLIRVIARYRDDALLPTWRARIEPDRIGDGRIGQRVLRARRADETVRYRHREIQAGDSG